MTKLEQFLAEAGVMSTNYGGLSTQEWLNLYNEAAKGLPEPGTILKGPYDDDGIVFVNLSTANEPYFYAVAIIPEQLSKKPSWCIHNTPNDKPKGLCCIINHESKNRLKKEFGLQEYYVIKGLKVVKQSSTKKSVICDVIFD